MFERRVTGGSRCHPCTRVPHRHRDSKSPALRNNLGSGEQRIFSGSGKEKIQAPVHETDAGIAVNAQVRRGRRISVRGRRIASSNEQLLPPGRKEARQSAGGVILREKRLKGKETNCHSPARVRE